MTVRPRHIAAAILLIIASALWSSVPPARAQSYGYSYLRIEFEKQPITNLVHDQKYLGWLQVESVTARTSPAAKNTTGETSSVGPAPKTKNAAPQWTKLPQILSSGRADAGKIRFGAGDDGGLSPLINAQKSKSLIESAELDLYEEDGGAFIGKYRLNGIRVLTLEDVPASACAMYVVTMSFRSAKKVDSPRQN